MTDDLRQLAEAATPGPWTQYQSGLPEYNNVCFGIEKGEALICGAAETEADAAYIAAAHPQAILALLDERDALRAAGLSLLALVDETDAYQKRPESGDWGVECACCMGELFQDDRAAIETARQALKGRV